MFIISVDKNTYTSLQKDCTRTRFFCKEKIKKSFEPSPENTQTRSLCDEKYLSRTSELTCLKPSKLHSLGVFAEKEIKEGSNMTTYMGEVIGAEISELREKRYDTMAKDYFIYDYQF